VIAKHWRWTQYTTLFYILAAYIPVLFTRETYRVRILQQRAKSQGISPPKRTLYASVVHFATVLLIRPVHMLLTEPIVTLVCIYGGFLFGLLYTFVVASPWVYEHYYNFSASAQALSFLGLIAGASLAPIPLVLIDMKIYQRRLLAFQVTYGEDVQFPPENRLYASLIGSITLPTCLFLFAWTARPSIHWIVPLIFQAMAMMSSTLIYATVNLFMLDAYGPLYGASASGAAMLSRYLLSAAFPLFGLRMYKALGAGWATSTLAFVTLAMAPIPWLFWRCGVQLRAKGKYEVSS
jgi:DHA1 family multidrug resistance protein-like MFS transporter